MTTNIDRAAEVIGRYVHPDFAEDAARDLADEGHLAPDPQIIRTVEELEALDPDTVVCIDREFATFQYADCTVPVELPAVLIRDGADVRAARKALEKETNND